LTKLLGLSALIVISAAALVTVISARGGFGNYGFNTRASQFESSQNFQNKALTIFVPSRIHAEGSAPLPFFVEIDPPQLIPPDSVLHIRGLPPGASLSEGHRVSADVWVVPIAKLSNLEIQVTAGVSQRSDLTLTLIRADGGLLASTHTVLSILEPVGRSVTVTADEETKAEEERAADDAGKAEPARRVAKAKNAEEERKAAEAAKKAEKARRRSPRVRQAGRPPNRRHVHGYRIRRQELPR
jgi:hypothetical protein